MAVESDDDEDIVTIIPGRYDHPDAVYALKDPTFLVRDKDVLYSTLGAIEYDASKAEDEKQRADIAKLEEDFDRGLEDLEQRIEEALRLVKNKPVKTVGTSPGGND